VKLSHWIVDKIRNYFIELGPQRIKTLKFCTSSGGDEVLEIMTHLIFQVLKIISVVEDSILQQIIDWNSFDYFWNEYS